ncbi:glutathione S-transferase N-terminal domain-containing protein [Polyangium sp. y55x31]|uniref:glutathione S-transferase family protein n=1 Tax=Polyangium sp. y55x31 TaxID=3042688 RepID=UPI002483275E|nr:glutathione S-transferase N-terminal domain-containing protein [Polyangium sp. y55x31]MDI1481957.1 glutathione S-transferase N-terminal domain-containing protein [Polyangium sp. y55x31]
MKVYGHPASTCTRKVLCALAEKGVNYEFVLVDIMKGEQKSPEHLARQPFGVVPVLEDDGFVLYESRAILRYLNAKLGGLAPTDAKDLGIMEQWISVEQSYFSPPAMKAILEIFFSPMKGTTPDQDVVAKGKADAAKALDVLERALVGKEFIAGSFSIAEITYAPYFQYLFDTGLGDIVKERPNVAAWWNRISERPSWQKAIGKAR